ncbi:MAG: cytochrome C oxidase subunit IV family protein [Ignavibacteriae bacterium]|nr:cytochrome C oxidase subunit IV family protein [Ignavibacteriota bacterium]
METAHAEDITKSVRKYIVVFVALMGLTIVTVAISYLHLNVGAAILFALAVATVKASLVASYFMHLISERKIVYWTLALTVVFFLLLMLLPISADQDSTRLG